MPFKDALIDKVIVGVAMAGALGGGSTVLTNWYRNGQQDVLIEQALTVNARLDRIESKIDGNASSNAEIKRDIDHLKKEQDRIREKLDDPSK